MTDFRDGNGIKGIANDTLSEGVEAVKQWPWYVRLGLPVLGLVIAAPVGWALLSKVFNPNPGALTPDQFKAVNSAGEQYFSSQRASVGGVSEAGRLASCSSQDSDGDKRVSCSGTVPFVKDGGIQFGTKRVVCDVPLKGASGCKDR